MKGSQRSMMHPPLPPDRLAQCAALAELGIEWRRRLAQWDPAHSSSSRHLLAVKAMNRRIAASSAWSGSPLHSSMKNFLNSSAIAQPRARIALVDEAGLFALALEGDVLAHVEPPAVEVEAAHRLH